MHCWWECKLLQPLWKTIWKFIKKLKIEPPYDPAIPLLGIYLKKIKTLIQKDTCTPTFTPALFTIANIWKQMCGMEYYLAIKKEWNFSICSNMDGLEGHYAVRQRKANLVWSHLYVESKKCSKLVNITKKKQIYRHREQTSVYQWDNIGL